MPSRASTLPAIDLTDQGEQYVLPGAERISKRELIERRMRERLKSDRPQKQVYCGLFGHSLEPGRLL